MKLEEYKKDGTKWKFEYNGVLCERLRDGRIKCGLCPCTFLTLKDLESHLKTHSKTQKTY